MVSNLSTRARKILSMLGRILLGWYRFIFKKRSEMSKARLKTCKYCQLRSGKFCGVCWCELDALSELTEEEGGICKHPEGSKWK